MGRKILPSDFDAKTTAAKNSNNNNNDNNGNNNNNNDISNNNNDNNNKSKINRERNKTRLAQKNEEDKAQECIKVD